MTRFFVSDTGMDDARIVLVGENAAHARVLRLKPEETVIVCNGLGIEWLCEVERVTADAVELNVKERKASESEPLVFTSIYMALPKADKLEHVIQKATELGAGEIITFPTARCVSRPDDKTLRKKLDRWQKIAASAAEQSGRGRIPEVIVLPSYSTALDRAAKADKAIVFYENERATTLHQMLSDGTYRSISLLSGPEGGFEPGEIQQAMDAGLSVCTLGKRILRCETAPLCALSAVMYDSGEF